MNRATLGLSLALVCGGIAIYTLVQNSLDSGNTVSEITSLDADPSHSEPSHVKLANPIPKQSTAQTASAVTGGEYEGTQQDDFEQELIIRLQNSYWKVIDQLHIQASLIRVKEFMLQRYPDDGEARFERVILAAFPDYAASILNILAGLKTYSEWLLANQERLSVLDFQDRQTKVWEKRYELFGDDAELIWAQETAELAGRGNAIQARLADLEQNTTMSLDEKLFQLQTALAEEQAGTLQNIVTSPNVVVQAFLSMESVQDSLGQMPVEERQAKINDFRRQSGYPEERIEELAKQDQERNARWENGLAYMAKREELESSLSGSDLEAALADLREEHFKHEAITIQREEEANFWRYKRPRVYGVN